MGLAKDLAPATADKDRTQTGPGAESVFTAWRLLIAVVATGVVLALTHIPQADMPDCLQAGGMDKVEHVGAYGLIALLYLLSVKRSAGLWVPLAIVLTLGTIAALDELTQPLVHRTCDIWDFASDMTGVLLACVAILVVRLRGMRWPRAGGPVKREA